MAINIGSIGQLTTEARELLERARDVAPRSYNPYSSYNVGAAVRTSTGEVFAGAFFENVSYGLTICAEPAAIVAANSAGHRDLTSIAVVGGQPNHVPADVEYVCTPCGRCRQIIAEIAHINGRDLEVYASNLTLSRVLLMSSGELLPHAFSPDQLLRP